MALDAIEELLGTVVLRQHGGFGRRECEPGWEWNPTLDDYDFWYVIAGSGALSINDGPQRQLEPGSLAVLRPGDHVQATQDSTARLTVLYCHFEFVDRTTGLPVTLPPESMPGPLLTVKQVGPIADALYRIVRRLRDRSALGHYAAGGMLMELLAQVYVQDAAQRGGAQGIDTRLQDAIELILDRPARRSSLDEVARAVGLSADQLSRLFVTQLGTTFRRFTVDARLDRACELLQHTVMTVSQISLVLGYSDQFLFSRQFRARYGEPPSAYRRSVHNSQGS
ncbi:AraC family transcriptional regulator [Agromyces allii]|uniref:HTH araC/xylS-type domain-containing protein n=1 Tax=Agromyces allii TaxID=393607 RepID=A0ABN2QMM6_9MICO|nr:AraC family transcriptional regulator [Agromyces allii]